MDSVSLLLCVLAGAELVLVLPLLLPSGLALRVANLWKQTRGGPALAVVGTIAAAVAGLLLFASAELLNAPSGGLKE